MVYASSNLSFGVGMKLITPGVPLGYTARGVRANTNGVVSLTAIDGSQVTLNVQAGEVIPLEVRSVESSTAQLHGFR